MCVEILTALKIKLNCYDTFCLGAQNLRAETLMLNEIRSRDNWINENLILCLNWYYAEEQKKYAIRDNLREMTEVHRGQEKKMNSLSIIQGLLEEVHVGESGEDFIYKIAYLSYIRIEGLPWWRSGWESACRCRGRGFMPWSGRITYAAEQLGPWATTTEPVSLEPVLRNKRGPDSERSAQRDEEWPQLATTRKSPHTETKTQHSQK